MDYELIENITAADIAIRVRANSLNELFIKGGIALMSEMLDDVSSIKKSIQGAVYLKEPIFPSCTSSFSMNFYFSGMRKAFCLFRLR